MRIAIATPTGKIGRHVVRFLQDAGETDLVLLARHPEKLHCETERGADAVGGDLYDAEYVTRATEGADALFWLAPANHASAHPCGDFRRLAENAAGAIYANRIKRVVHISSVGAHRSEKLGLIVGLHDAEETLNEAHGAATHLRVGYLMENYLAAIDSIRRHGRIYLPVSGFVRVPLIAAADVAEVAAGILTDDTWAGIPHRAFELHGPADVSFDESAAIIGEVLGREVRHEQISPDRAREVLSGIGWADRCVDQWLEIYAGIQSGWYSRLQPRSDASRTPTTFKRFIQNVLAPAVLEADLVGHV